MVFLAKMVSSKYHSLVLKKHQDVNIVTQVVHNCQGHEDPQEQRLKQRSKSNFQTRNKTRLCNLKIRTQEHKTRTRDMQKKRENRSLLCKHEHEKNMTRLWCKIVPKTNVEQTEGNEASYFYLYPFGYLAQGSFQGGIK
jgi:hypothetical protein